MFIILSLKMVCNHCPWSYRQGVATIVRYVIPRHDVSPVGIKALVDLVTRPEVRDNRWCQSSKQSDVTDFSVTREPNQVKKLKTCHNRLEVSFLFQYLFTKLHVEVHTSQSMWENARRPLLTCDRWCRRQWCWRPPRTERWRVGRRWGRGWEWMTTRRHRMR